MPQMSGLDAIIAMRAECPEGRIIVLTRASDVQAPGTWWGLGYRSR
jgi:DNA-binding NarL/FixJ family response regulator